MPDLADLVNDLIALIPEDGTRRESPSAMRN
jgi:hypothetical protein